MKKIEEVLERFDEKFGDYTKNPPLWKGNRPPDGRKIKAFIRTELKEMRRAGLDKAKEVVTVHKLLEVSSDSVTLMWKQRINRRLDNILSGLEVEKGKSG